MALKMNAAELTAFLLAEFPQVADEFDISRPQRGAVGGCASRA